MIDFILIAQEKMIGMMKWLGISYDFGPGKPNQSIGSFIQSERSAIYQKYANQLLENGNAYRCYCSPQRLDKIRSLGSKSFGYDQHCLHLDQDKLNEYQERNIPFSVRFKVPHGAPVAFQDMVHGKLSVPKASLDDMILLKSDGLPTYHLANVVDDHLMGITHVLRGDEWIASTPKHILLYQAFGWNAPQFAHLPLLLAKGGTKLSKRNNDVHVEVFKEKGYLPEALINFVAQLGWSPSNEKGCTIEELAEQVKLCDLSHL
jgi:glutamyl-tRNA synthetase